MTNTTDAKLAALLEAIAQEHCFHTTELQNSGDDFKEVASWSLEAALRAAYEAGKAAR